MGSVRLVVNAVSGDVAQELDYDEFGVVTTDTNPGFQPFGFAGDLDYSYDQRGRLIGDLGAGEVGVAGLDHRSGAGGPVRGRAGRLGRRAAAADQGEADGGEEMRFHDRELHLFPDRTGVEDRGCLRNDQARTARVASTPSACRAAAAIRWSAAAPTRNRGTAVRPSASSARTVETIWCTVG